MISPPTNIRSISEQSVLELTWPDGSVARLPYFTLRCACPCAGCVDEMTGLRTLDPDDVPSDVRPLSIGFSGNYALKIEWSDGHNSGIYTWDRLGELSRAVQA
jgi:DUF971 family protein